MSPEKQNALRIASIAACTSIYFTGVALLISVSADAPMGAVTDIRASLLAYGGTAALCLIAMSVYARCIPVAGEEGRQ